MIQAEHKYRRRVRWVAMAALLTVAATALGAIHANQESHNKLRRSGGLVRGWQEWSQTLVVAVPGEQRQAWTRVADECPLVILQACVTSAP